MKGESLATKLMVPTKAHSWKERKLKFRKNKTQLNKSETVAV